MIGWIYKLTAPNGKIYIGQTINLKARFSVYSRSDRRKNKSSINYSIIKYGWDSFLKEILFEGECTIDELNDLEVKYISKYNSTDSSIGLNLMVGGKNGLHHETTKKKMSESAKLVWSDKEYAKQRNSHWVGRKHSDATKEKMKNCGAIRGASKEKLDSIREQGLAKVRKFVLNTETGIFYDSIIEASESINMNYRTFKNKVNGSKRNNTSFIIA